MKFEADCKTENCEVFAVHVTLIQVVNLVKELCLEVYFHVLWFCNNLILCLVFLFICNKLQSLYKLCFNNFEEFTFMKRGDGGGGSMSSLFIVVVIIKVV